MQLAYNYLFNLSMRRFMQTFEESWNTVQCGVFLLILTALCSVVFSFITVRYPMHLREWAVVKKSTVLNLL